MSLILDALNRADHERSKENRVLDAPSVQLGSNIKIYPVLRWSIELLVVLAIGLFFYSQWADRSIRESAKDQISVQRSDNPTSSANKKPTPNATNLVPASTNEDSVTIGNSTPRASKTNSEATLQNKPESNPEVEVATKSKNRQENKPTINPAISSLYQQPTVKQIPEKATEIGIDDSVTESSGTDDSTIDNSLTILNSIPLLSELSTRFQRNIPSIEYTLHVYAENGGFVVLNGKQYKVGGLPVPQLRVIAILKNSLVLDFQGKTFRLLALNSWMNFN